MSHCNYFFARISAPRTAAIIVTCLSLVIVFNTYTAKTDMYFYGTDERSFELHKSIVDRYYQSRNSWNTSRLGAILFKNEEYPAIDENKRTKTFTILFWKHWKMLQNRHVFHYGSNKEDPLNGCSVTNCVFTGDDDLLNTADAVVVHLQRGVIPSSESRKPSQRWIFLNDESPYNVFSLANEKPNLSDLHNVFNWSMLYRSDADVPVPYGRTVALKVPRSSSQNPQIADIIPNWKHKRRDVLVAILISNCGVLYRMKLIKELKKYIPVDVHGQCGDKKLKNSCPGHFKSDCKVMSDYLFYLALENTQCKEYITEKPFHNAYSRGAIPIIQGPSLEECKNLLPPNSYLHVDNYATAKDLADDILKISLNKEVLLNYHKWRNHFEAANEHGYFGSKSFHLCRLCEAMNYNDDKSSIYSEENIRQFLDPTKTCRK